MKKFNLSNFLNNIYQNHNLIYKVILFVLTAFAIVYFFPKGGQFKYEYQQGKPWQYDNLFAPFDFSIQKSPEEVEKEKQEITAKAKQYYTYNKKTEQNVTATFNNAVEKLPDSIAKQSVKERAIKNANQLISKIYKTGYIDEASAKTAAPKELVVLRKGNVANDIVFDKLLKEEQIKTLVINLFERFNYSNQGQLFTNLLLKNLTPNVKYDKEFTDKMMADALDNISYTEGLITENERIIAKGDIVQGHNLQLLNSLKAEYESQVWNQSSYNWILFGYIILVALALLMLLLFLKTYRKAIYEDNTKVTFIFFNIFLMVLIMTLVIKYNASYVYVVPLIILPIVIKAFFDARLGLFSHFLTVLLLGFVVPNSFEFIFLQIIAGMVTILTVSELYKRANLFISLTKVTIVYIVAYFAFSIIQEGNTAKINWEYFVLFALNGVLSFLSLFLILIYEKVFGLVSDISLLELSNTNTKLLRELAEKAPGTFQHSIQVANLAEAAANEIGANSMLTRVGALYHDIGKMVNPKYFTENQITNVNPHNELSPKDSARIIINHVIDGIEMAKKNRLPDRIIDFIRTHHGTTLAYYFYKKQEAENPDNLNVKDFQYKGPIPFSKETAILMMCDASEAASKSLKEPNAALIDELIDKIVAGQMKANQFMNANITFREILSIKKVIKKKLLNIYQLRVEYPE
ncbi:MAG: phosphohydrolase [Flavobacteriales bacterium]|nr:MAG: phosphohydrolase [Flavobacteriales bacterium]